MSDLTLSIDIGFKNTPIDYLETIAYPLVEAVVVQLHPMAYLEDGLEAVLNDPNLTLKDPMMVIKYAISKYCGYAYASPHGQFTEFDGDVLTAGNALLEKSKTLKYLVAANILNSLLYNTRLNEDIDASIFDALMEYTKQLALIPVGVFFGEVEALSQKNTD
jgi:hypothetical protein